MRAFKQRTSAKTVKQVPIYDLLGKRFIEIPPDFDMIAPGVNLVPDDGMIVVIPSTLEGNFTLHKYLGERERKAWREGLLSDRDRDPREIEAERDTKFALIPDLPDIPPAPIEPAGEDDAGFKDGYENLSEPADEDDDGPTWSEPWPPPVMKIPAPTERKRGWGRQREALRPRHTIRFFDLVGRSVGYGLWNGTVSLAFPWVCESEASALAARTQQDPEDWLTAWTRCTHLRRVAIAYRAIPRPMHWPTTYCPECGFHDERDPADSLKVRGHPVFQWGPPPWPWET